MLEIAVERAFPSDPGTLSVIYRPLHKGISVLPLALPLQRSHTSVALLAAAAFQRRQLPNVSLETSLASRRSLSRSLAALHCRSMCMHSRSLPAALYSPPSCLWALRQLATRAESLRLPFVVFGDGGGGCGGGGGGGRRCSLESPSPCWSQARQERALEEL